MEKYFIPDCVPMFEMQFHKSPQYIDVLLN